MDANQQHTTTHNTVHPVTPTGAERSLPHAMGEENAGIPPVPTLTCASHPNNRARPLADSANGAGSPNSFDCNAHKRHSPPSIDDANNKRPKVAMPRPIKEDDDDVDGIPMDTSTDEFINAPEPGVTGETVVAAVAVAAAAADTAIANINNGVAATSAGTQTLNQYVIPNLDNLRCPVSGKLFADPVLMSDGQTYEREEIDKVIASTEKHKRIRSPQTGTVIERKRHPNTAITDIIQKLYDNDQLGDEGDDWKQRKMILLLKKRASKGDGDAMRDLGMLFERSDDGSLAFSWYQKGADQLHLDCLVRAGLFLKTGKDVEKNEAQALAYIFQAAHMGNGHGMYLLGRWNHKGMCGLPKNNKMALYWLDKVKRNEFAEGSFDEVKYMSKVDRMLEAINEDAH